MIKYKNTISKLKAVSQFKMVKKKENIYETVFNSFVICH